MRYVCVRWISLSLSIPLLTCSCLNSPLQWTGNSSSSSSVQITAPNSSTTINDSNEYSFAINGTCSNSGSSVYIFVNGSYQAMTTCNSANIWTTALNLSALPYDSTVSIAVGSSSTYSSSFSTVSYSKSFCSAPGYMTSSTIPGSGNGTTSNPYRICTAQQFYNQLNGNQVNWTYTYSLMNDIDLSPYPNISIGTSGVPFSGTFNGNNHAINNVTFTSAASTAAGLFSFTAGATISNLILNTPSVSGTASVTMLGTLIGEDGPSGSTVLTNITINSPLVTSSATTLSGIGGGVGYVYESVAGLSAQNVTVNNPSIMATSCGTCYEGGFAGSITSSGVFSQIVVNGGNIGSSSGSSSYVGGIAGSLQHPTLTNSSSSATVYAAEYVGGLVGTMTGSTSITNDLCTGNVTATGSSFGYVGGIIGQANGTNSISTSAFVGIASSDLGSAASDSAGGIVGEAISGTLTIQNSYAQGSVTVGGSAGTAAGLVAATASSAIVNLSEDYAAVNEGSTGTLAGIGASSSGTTFNITNVYWDNTIGAPTAISGSGSVTGTPIGYTTNQMYSASTYVGFDFVTPVWIMPNSGYPLLSWQ